MIHIREKRRGLILTISFAGFITYNTQPNSPDLLWRHQQQLGDRRGGGHGVTVDSVDLEGSGHTPHPLVGGQDLLITNQNSVWIFNWGQSRKRGEKMEECETPPTCKQRKSMKFKKGESFV